MSDLTFNPLSGQIGAAIEVQLLDSVPANATQSDFTLTVGSVEQTISSFQNQGNGAALIVFSIAFGTSTGKVNVEGAFPSVPEKLEWSNDTTLATQSIDPSLSTPASFSLSTQLMQDAVTARGVSVGEGQYNQEALFANPFLDGREEALVINGDNHLTYLQRTDTSDTGWLQSPVTAAGTSQFAEVVVLVHPNRGVWAVCAPPASSHLPVQVFLLTKTGENPDGTAVCSWTAQPNALGQQVVDAYSLCVSYSPDAGATLLMRVSGGGCQFYAPGIASPDTPSAPLSPWVFSASCLFTLAGRVVGGGFMPYTQNGDRMSVFYVLDNGSLTRYASPNPGTWASQVISSTVGQFCGTWNVPNLMRAAPQGDVGYMYVAKNGDLVTGYIGNAGGQRESRVGGLNFVEGTTCWQDADGMLHVFGQSGAQSGQAGTLRVLHQSGWDVDSDGTTTFPVKPVWTSAQVAGGPGGIGGYDLARPNDHIVAFDYAGTGKADHLLAYRPGPDHYYSDQTVWVIKRTTDPETPFTPAWRSTTGLSTAFPFTSPATQVVPYDYTGSGSTDHLLVYVPGSQGGYSIFTRPNEEDGLVSVDSSPSGIAGLNLYQPTTRLVPFDYAKTGKNDHLFYYSPGGGNVGVGFVLAPKPGGGFTNVTPHGVPNLGGFPLDDPAAIITGFDYDSSGSNKYLLAYRPASNAGMCYIVTPDSHGNFTAVVHNPTGGIGAFPLTDPLDRLLPFDYTGLGFNDHLMAYQPGHGIVWILERRPNSNAYTAVVQSDDGLGGYDFSSTADALTAYDYYGTGSLKYLVAYRPGTGKASVFGQRGGQMEPVYQVLPTGSSTTVTVGLHANITSFLVDPYPDYKPSQLIKMSGTSLAEAYCICTQDVTTSQWQMDKVRIPDPPPIPNKPSATQPHIVSHYVADATLLDKRGAPMPGYNVTVSADSLVEVQIGAVSYQVGPGRAIVATTDNSGKLILSIAARSLNPPIVHLIADGLPSGTAVDFASKANDFLAGSGTLPSQNGRFTADLLEHAAAPPNSTPAQMRRADPPPPLVQNWAALKERGLTPQVVVDHCSNVYGQAAGNSDLQFTVEGFKAPQTVHSYVIQLWDPDRPAFQAFHNQDELDAYKAYRNSHPAYGGWWDDFTSFASDVWEGIKSGAAKVAEVVVSAVTEIAIWVGDAIVSLGEMIISAIEQAVQAVEAVFQMIADAIVHVIDWLKSLFDFQDIWNTKTVLENAITSLMPRLKPAMVYCQGQAHGWFEKQEHAVSLMFLQLKAKFADGMVQDLGNQVPAATDSSGAAVDRGTMSANPQANWMLNQTTTSSTRHPQQWAEALGGANPQAVDWLDQMLEALSTSGIPDVLESMQDLITGLFSGDSNHSSIVDLLDLLEKIAIAILKTLDLLSQAILGVLTQAATGVLATLSEPVTIPFITALYDWIKPAGDTSKCTYLSLGCLIFGFIGTVLYKLVNGVQSPPFAAGTQITVPRAPWETGHDLALADADPADVNKGYAVYLGVEAFIAIFGNLIYPIMDFDLDNTSTPSCFPIINLLLLALGVIAACPPFTNSTGGEWWAIFGIAIAMFITECVAYAAEKTALRNIADKYQIPLPGAIFTFIMGVILFSLTLVGTLKEQAEAPVPPIFWAGEMTEYMGDIFQVFRPIIKKFVPPNFRPIAAGIVAALDGTACEIAALSWVVAMSSSSMSITEETFLYNGQLNTTVGMYVSHTVGYLVGANEGNPVAKSFEPVTIDTNPTFSQLTLPAGLSVDPHATTPTFSGAIAAKGDYPIKLRLLNSSWPPQYSSIGQAHINVGDTKVGKLQFTGATKAQSMPISSVGPAAAMTVTVFDTSNHPLPGAAVIISLPDPTKGPSATFDPSVNSTPQTDGTVTTMLVTGADGEAELPNLWANEKTGEYTITAFVPGVAAATDSYTITNKPCLATAIIPGDHTTPQSALGPHTGWFMTSVPGSDFPYQLTATVKDAVGNPVPNMIVNFAGQDSYGQFSNTGSATTTCVSSAGPDDTGAVNAGTFTNYSATNYGSFTITAQIPGGPSCTYSMTNLQN